MPDKDTYSVIGIHNETVDGVEQGQTVARVRMFVGEQIIDENIELPKLVTPEEQLHAAVQERVAEIKAGKLDPKQSTVLNGNVAAEQEVAKLERQDQIPETAFDVVDTITKEEAQATQEQVNE